MKYLSIFPIIAIFISLFCIHPVPARAESMGAAVSSADSEMDTVSRDADAEDVKESMDQNSPNSDALITDDAD